MLENMLGKPWFKSLTVWGLILWVGASASLNEACSGGLLASGTCDTLTHITAGVGQVLTFLGIRRAATPAP